MRTSAYAFYRALFFSLVTGPSLALFIAFLLLTFNNSLAGTFLINARQLVGEAPAGKVWTENCIYPPASTNKEIGIPVQEFEPLSCQHEQVNAADWQQNMDSIIRQMYLYIVAISLVCWLVFPDNTGLAKTIDWSRKTIRAIRTHVAKGE